MSREKRSKKELLEAIRKMKEGGDSITFLTDIGVVGVGAVGGTAAALAFGGTTATALFGLVAIPVAAPLAVVAGGTVLGGAALLGLKRILVDGTAQDGKKAEIVKHLEEQIREIEETERRQKINADDKKRFHIFLEQPIELDLISPEDAQKLMELVETGKIAISDAYKHVKSILDEHQGDRPALSASS